LKGHEKRLSNVQSLQAAGLCSALTINLFWATEHAGVNNKQAFCHVPTERILPLLLRWRFSLIPALGFLEVSFKANWGYVHPWPGERRGHFHHFAILLLFGNISLQMPMVSSRTLLIQFRLPLRHLATWSTSATSLGPCGWRHVKKTWYNTSWKRQHTPFTRTCSFTSRSANRWAMQIQTPNNFIFRV
jgi:hypothetical protein